MFITRQKERFTCKFVLSDGGLGGGRKATMKTVYQKFMQESKEKNWVL